jgi:hypothetical protein
MITMRAFFTEGLSSLCLLFLITSCSSTNAPSISTTQFEQGIGNWTYVDASAQLGSPEKVASLKTGETSAIWPWKQTTSFQPDEFNPRTSTYDPKPLLETQEQLVMDFDKDGILESWRIERIDETMYSRNARPMGPDPITASP